MFHSNNVAQRIGIGLILFRFYYKLKVSLQNGVLVSEPGKIGFGVYGGLLLHFFERNYETINSEMSKYICI